MNIKEISSRYSLNEKESLLLENYVKTAFPEKKLTCQLKKKSGESLSFWEKIIGFGNISSAGYAINTFVCPKRPVSFTCPEGVRIELYSSFAGMIPTIYVDAPQDFEQLVTNIVYKGQAPKNLSQTGAMFVFGKTTRLIILSAKPYSNVPAEEMGLTATEWAWKSMIIRREHEITHYYTKQVFGVSRQHLYDELIADFFGLYEAFGFYRAKWFQQFMGIVGPGEGRLRFYVSEFSPRLFQAVQEIARLASEGLERYSLSEEFRTMGREQRLVHLCEMGLLTMVWKNSVSFSKEKASYMFLSESGSRQLSLELFLERLTASCYFRKTMVKSVIFTVLQYKFFNWRFQYVWY